MNTQIIVGIVAGLASALLYLSGTTGSVLAMFLFYIAPLPLFVAGFGWGLVTALIASGAGAVLAAVIFHPFAGVLFLLAFAAPVVWLLRLSLLARPMDDNDPNSPMEWYPVSYLLLWAVGLAVFLVMAAIIGVGGSVEGLQETIGNTLREAIEGNRAQLQLPDEFDPEALIGLVQALIAPMAAGLWTLSTLLNMLLACRIAQSSGVGKRPMPSSQEITLPRIAVPLLAAALALTFLGGLPQKLGIVASAAFLVVYTLVGLAFIHERTRGVQLRGVILFTVYLSLFLFGWTALVIAILGLTDVTLGLRQRGQTQGPGSPPNRPIPPPDQPD